MAKAYISPKNVVADKTYMVNGVPLYQYFIYDHNINNMKLPAKRSKKVIGVTIHNTDDLENVQDDGRQYTAATCNDNMRDVFVNAYVDELGAWWNFDWTYENWSCKDGRGNGNTATIAIECVMDGQTGANNEKAMDNTARLAAWLLYKYGLTVNDLYTHTHWLNVVDGVTGDRDYLNTRPNPYKTCPIYIIPQWDKFKRLVDTYVVKLGGKSVYKNTTTTKPSTSPTTTTTSKFPYQVKIKIDSLNVRKGAGLSNPVVAVCKKNYVYTIVAEKKIRNKDGSIATWGLLKSYEKNKNGWINVGANYVTKVVKKTNK